MCKKQEKTDRRVCRDLNDFFQKIRMNSKEFKKNTKNCALCKTTIQKIVETLNTFLEEE